MPQFTGSLGKQYRETQGKRVVKIQAGSIDRHTRGRQRIVGRKHRNRSVMKQTIRINARLECFALQSEYVSSVPLNVVADYVLWLDWLAIHQSEVQGP